MERFSIVLRTRSMTRTFFLDCLIRKTMSKRDRAIDNETYRERTRQKWREKDRER